MLCRAVRSPVARENMVLVRRAARPVLVVISSEVGSGSKSPMQSATTCFARARDIWLSTKVSKPNIAAAIQECDDGV